MIRFRICDVETIPHPDAHKWVEPVKAPANYKKQEAIDAYIKEATAERDEKLGLDPDLNRIICLGYKDMDGGDPTAQICQDEDMEAVALMDFWASYRKAETKLVTFFGLGFDLPVLMRRSLYLGVKYPPLNIDRYRTTHIDICAKLSFNGALKTKGLKFYCRRFGIQTNDPFDGSQVAQMAAEGRWQDIQDHCIADLGATQALAQRLGLLEAA